jgi:transitional endoplasmic reticulum ATPase
MFEDEEDYTEAIEIYKTLIEKVTDKKYKKELSKKIALLEEKLGKIDTEDFKKYTTTFKDVIGLEKQKEFIYKLIALTLNKAHHFERLKLQTSTGILLYGAPGTGKTLMMEAISGELQIPMLDVKIEDVLQKYVGDAEKHLKEIFEAAKRNQPCILFFDEINTLTTDNGGGEGYAGEKESILSAFLKQMSDIHRDLNSKIFICGATNKPWDIDNRIKRSGRFENIVYIRPSNTTERIKLFKYYLRNVHKEDLLGNIQWLWLSLATIGYSPADIEKICKLAQHNFIKRDLQGKLTTKDILKVLRDKEEGRSSLDEWYMTMWDDKIKPSKYKHSQGLGKTILNKATGGKLASTQDILEKGGDFTKEERKLYKGIVKDVRWHIKNNFMIQLTRAICRGI